MLHKTEIMVDKRTLEFALSDQNEEREEYAQETLCQRCEGQQIDLDSTQAQIVIGVRRSGKSTLCYQTLRDKGVKYAYVNFDDEQLIGLKASDLNDVLEVLYKIYGDFNYLFLDEIQNIEGWHLFVNRLLRKKMHIILTDSNAKQLSGGLAIHFSGRSKEVSLFPFSFREYCTMKSVDTERRTTKAEAFRRAAFDDYLKQGGFPELLSISDGRSYVSNLVDNILKRDIEQRHRITFKAAFENMANHLLNNAPTVVVTKDLSGTFGFKSEHTVKNYMDFLKQAYLLVGLQKYSQKSKQRMTQEKVYAIDVAMMNQRENAFSGDNLGRRLETTVFIHLLRECKIEGWDLYYLNERSGECDFVVCQSNEVLQCIQVSYDISVEKTRKREVAGAVLAAERTRCENLLLLTDHDSDAIHERGHIIKVQPVYEWALELGV